MIDWLVLKDKSIRLGPRIRWLTDNGGHGAGKIIKSMEHQRPADIGALRRRPGAVTVAKVNVVADANIVANSCNRLDRPAQLKLDLQSVGLALGQHGLDVMIEFSGIFWATPPLAQEGPQLGFTRVQVEEPGGLSFGEPRFTPNHIPGKAIVVGKQQHAIRRQTATPHFHHRRPTAILTQLQ